MDSNLLINLLFREECTFPNIENKVQSFIYVNLFKDYRIKKMKISIRFSNFIFGSNGKPCSSQQMDAAEEWKNTTEI